MKERQTCTRAFHFDYGHRVLGHEGKCRYLHGHRGVAQVTFRAQLDKLGMVIDFGLVKELIGGWIENNWDHNFLCSPPDPFYLLYRKNNTPGLVFDPLIDQLFNGRAPYVMRNGNPTAENMAHELYDNANAVMAKNHLLAHVVKVRLYETTNCWADYSREEIS